MELLFLLLVVIVLLAGPLVGADSRDGHDWTPHYLWPYPGGDGGDGGDYWSEKAAVCLSAPPAARRYRAGRWRSVRRA